MKMDGMRKVVWAEGIFLGQQHFQQWDRYQEAVQGLFARSLNPLSWGVFDLRFDLQALENGRLRLERCLAMFPDGRLISHGGDDAPLMCELGGRGGETLDVFLCLPGNRQVGGISGYAETSHRCAWQADYREVADEFDGARNREVLLARPNLMLLTAEQSRDAFSCLPVARVLNQGDGSFELVSEFIPPVARIGASPRLSALLTGMVDVVGARLRTLQDKKSAYGGGAGEFAQADPLNFQLLQVLCGIWPLLSHYQQHPDLHPEFAYRSLAPLLGSLGAFAAGGDGIDIPPYRHDALESVFPALLAQLEGLMQVQSTPRSAALMLERENECLWRVEGVASEVFSQGTIFLEVDHGAEDPNWINDFCRQVKIGPRSAIELMVASALAGVRLVHTQRPPARMAVRSGCEYFRLEARGDFWNKMVEEGSITAFVPHVFAQAQLALVMVRE